MSTDPNVVFSSAELSPEQIREEFLAFNAGQNPGKGHSKAQIVANAQLFLDSMEGWASTAPEVSLSEYEPDNDMGDGDYELGLFPELDFDTSDNNGATVITSAGPSDSLFEIFKNVSSRRGPIDPLPQLEFYETAPKETHTPAETSENLDNGQKLERARNELAALSVSMRAKSFRKLSQAQRVKFDFALNNYRLAYEAVSHDGVTDLLLNGEDEDTAAELLAYANDAEHKEFALAEQNAYGAGKRRLVGLTDSWARKGNIKRALWGGGAGAVVTAIGTTAVALSGVGAAVAGVSLLSVKAAKSIGMYKLNKNSRTATEFAKKALEDRQSASNIRTSHNLTESTALAGEALINTLKNRVESDQKENRKRLTVAIGAVAVGAVAGSLIHNLVHGGGRSSGLLKDKATSPKVKPTVTTGSQPVTESPRLIGPLPHQPVPEVTAPHAPSVVTVHEPIRHIQPRPNHDYGTQKPTVRAGHTKPMNHDYGSQKPPVHTAAQPVTASETPVAAPSPSADINLSRPTWSVAHDLTPGHEIPTMQNGINAFNNLHNTHFALTPHNGTTWIIDNGRAINPAQMAELNTLMLQDDLLTAGV